MEKVINEKNIRELSFSKVKVKNLLENNNPSASVSKISLNGENEKCKNNESDIYYYIIKGEGLFYINNKKYPVAEGCLVYIPKNAIYQDTGNLEMVAFSTPKFNVDNVEFI